MWLRSSLARSLLPLCSVQAAAKVSSFSKWDVESSGSEVDPDEVLTEEERQHKKKFREWRKKHYNEFHAVKRARELMKKVLLGSRDGKQCFLHQ